MCHGLAGYFDAQLYKDVHLSILPSTHTPNMFSWFPIYFPVKEPFVVPKGERCGEKRKGEGDGKRGTD